MVELNLTEAELVAKNHFTRLLLEGSKKPCDVSGEIEAKLPKWYDDSQFKRGKKYFADNRFGMMQSNYCGLVSLLREPKGVKILHSTGQSSDKVTARKRYISTIMHMLSWYEVDLSPGSKSWDSLNRVRKMHLLASMSAESKELGFISQAEISATTFGFMGYALLRPHLMGIQYDNDKDREAFVHFWAVMDHMLGVQDEYNFCLNSLEVVIKICEISLRYIFLPLLQIEMPLSKEMIQAVVDGLERFQPIGSYEAIMFIAKRIAGVPGYQVDVDMEKESLIKSYFTLEELNALKLATSSIKGYEYLTDVILEDKMVLLDVIRHGEQDENDNIEEHLDNMDSSRNVQGVYRQSSDEFLNKPSPLHQLLGLRYYDEIKITRLEGPEEWRAHLNDSKLEKLTGRDKRCLDLMLFFLRNCSSGLGKYLCEGALSLMLYRMRNFKE